MSLPFMVGEEFSTGLFSSGSASLSPKGSLIPAVSEDC